jgi:hypothetical protein
MGIRRPGLTRALVPIQGKGQRAQRKGEDEGKRKRRDETA